MEWYHPMVHTMGGRGMPWPSNAPGFPWRYIIPASHLSSTLFGISKKWIAPNQVWLDLLNLATTLTQMDGLDLAITLAQMDGLYLKIPNSSAILNVGNKWSYKYSAKWHFFPFNKYNARRGLDKITTILTLYLSNIHLTLVYQLDYNIITLIPPIFIFKTKPSKTVMLIWIQFPKSWFTLLWLKMPQEPAQKSGELSKR